MKKLIIIFLLLATGVFAQEMTGVTSLSVSLVNQDPDPAVAGDLVEVRVGIENTGGDPAQNIVLELLEDYPFSAAAGQDPVVALGTIGPYQDEDNIRIVKYLVKVDREATAGTYEIRFRYYQQGQQAQTQKSLNIDIENQESAEVIYIDKTLLVPGRESNMKFTINNVGSSPLRDLTFYWENDDSIVLPVGSDNTRYIKYIDVGKSEELEYRVVADTNADPGLYELGLHLSYSDPLTDTEKEISTIAGVYVGGETDFEVAFSDNTGGEMSFSIANIGSNPASSVSVIVPEQQGWKVTGSNSMIIGNLNKGDYTVASFTLNGHSDIVQVQVAYTDTRGERLIVTKDVGMNSNTVMSTGTTSAGTTRTAFQNRGTVQQVSFWSQYRWYIIAAVLVFGGIVIRVRYKKKKLLNPKSRFKDIFK